MKNSIYSSAKKVIENILNKDEELTQVSDTHQHSKYVTLLRRKRMEYEITFFDDEIEVTFNGSYGEIPVQIKQWNLYDLHYTIDTLIHRVLK